MWRQYVGFLRRARSSAQTDGKVVRSDTGEGNGATFDLQSRLVVCEGDTAASPAGLRMVARRSRWTATRGEGKG
jgi:hypothetical protein